MCPAASIFLIIFSFPRIFLPITKNVAGALNSVNNESALFVYSAFGPSSKVMAICFSFVEEQQIVFV